MKYIIILFFLIALSSSLFSQPTIIITEVLANSLASPKFHEEFIELYNSTTYQINLAGWRLTNGDNLAEINPWDTSKYPGLKNPYPVITDTTIIQPGQYAIVISTWYLATIQRYTFPKNTLLLTTTQYRYSVFYDGPVYAISLSSNDPVTLYNSNGTALSDVVSTFGMPKNEDNWKKRKASSSDFPYDAGNGISWERVIYTAGDFYSIDETSTNWKPSLAFTGNTPGAKNSVSPQDTSEEIKKTEKILQVFNSPFFPHGEHAIGEVKKSAKISYNVPKDATITLRIFDARGNLILTPINQEKLLCNLHNPEASRYCVEENGRYKGTYYWGGRNESGQIVPIGVYICYIEAVEPDKGKVHKSKAGLVVGRKLH